MTFEKYKTECVKRWHGYALIDALAAWRQWEEMREYLVDVMKQFLHNPFQKDLGGEYHNPDGSLREFLFHCQEAIDPSCTRLNPFLDFEEHYQKIFLRRGLIIYCKGILQELEMKSQPNLQQTNLFARDE